MIARNIEPVTVRTAAVATPTNAAEEPTERSISPVRMTKVIPMATIRVIDTCLVTFSRFLELKKKGDINEKTTIRITRIRISPNSPLSIFRNLVQNADLSVFSIVFSICPNLQVPVSTTALLKILYRLTLPQCLPFL